MVCLTARKVAIGLEKKNLSSDTKTTTRTKNNAMSLDFLFGHCPPEGTDDDDPNKKTMSIAAPLPDRLRRWRGWRERERLFGAEPLVSRQPFWAN